MGKAYRDGWEQVFGPKPAPKVTRHPFPLRRGMVINVELPSDLRLRDLRRFAQYLATMCDDWEPEMGLPVLMFASAGTVGGRTAAEGRNAIVVAFNALHLRPGHHPPCLALLDDEAVCTCGQ